MAQRTLCDWKFQFSGQFRAEGPEIVVDFLPTAKTVRVLQILVSADRNWVMRDRIAASLWPGTTVAKSRSNLRQALATLRKAFHPYVIIETDNARVRLALTSVEHDCDGTEPEMMLQQMSASVAERDDDLEDFIKRGQATSPGLQLDNLIRSVIHGNPDRAMSLLVASPDLSVTMPVQSLRSHALRTASSANPHHTNQGWLNYFIAYTDLMLGQYEDGVAHFLEARKQAIQNADRNLYIECLMFLSLAHTELGHPNKAVQFAEEGLQHASSSRHKSEFAKLTHAKGAAYFHAGHASRGIEVVSKAADMLRIEGKDVERAHCFSNLYVFAQEGQFRSIAEYARHEATQWSACAADQRSEAACQYGDMIGSIRRGDYDLGESHAKALDSYGRSIGSHPFQAYAAEGMAQIAIARGQYQSAAEHLATALTSRRSQGFRASVIERKRLRTLAESVLNKIPAGSAPTLAAL